MPTHKLRSQAARLLTRALEAQESGRTAQAHAFTMKAAHCLQDAMSVERLRGASARMTAPARLAPQPRRVARSVSKQSQR